jgi:hypothetical protein
MTTHLQLNPPWPVMTPDGPGFAMIMTDYSQEHDRVWCVALNDGRFGDYKQSSLRSQQNISIGRVAKANGLENDKGRLFDAPTNSQQRIPSDAV